MGGVFRSSVHKDNEFQCPWEADIVIVINRQVSPSRLERTVSIPLARDLWFW
jgi:hypothetical protein